LTAGQGEAVALLALMAGQDVEPGEGCDGTDGRWRIARRVAEDRVISTVDAHATPPQQGDDLLVAGPAHRPLGLVQPMPGPQPPRHPPIFTARCLGQVPVMATSYSNDTRSAGAVECKSLREHLGHLIGTAA